MAEKIVDITRAREQKKHELKEQKLESLKDRFSKAMGMNEKPKNKLSAWRRKKKPKSKPTPEGW